MAHWIPTLNRLTLAAYKKTDWDVSINNLWVFIECRFNKRQQALILLMQQLRSDRVKSNVILYLDDEREPLIQVPADRLQNTQLCSGSVQGEVLWICGWMTCNKKIRTFTDLSLLFAITSRNTGINLELKSWHTDRAEANNMGKINVDAWRTYQPGCSKKCQVCLMGAVCFCPCLLPGLVGSHWVDSVCSATRGVGVSQQHSKTIRCKSIFFKFPVDCEIVAYSCRYWQLK